MTLQGSECRPEKPDEHEYGKEETDGDVELSIDVYWVGAIDCSVRDFHGFTTHGGTTYNSYLVIGKKTALIDMVKAPFT